jgi:hypothetical protein
MYQIEKGIPIPKKYARVYQGLTKTLRAMEIGDSFVLPNTVTHPHRNVHSTARHAGCKVTARKQPDNSVRVWRIE